MQCGLILGLVAMDGGGCSPAGPPVAADLTQIELKVFRGSCVFSACHGDTTPQQGLSLVSPTYGMLVDHPASEVPGMVRVAPGAPERSYLWEKLSSDSPAMGQRMPPGQSLDSALIASVRQWILEGAMDD